MEDISWNNTTVRDGLLLDVELEHITGENRLLLGLDLAYDKLHSVFLGFSWR